jgi:hypothetical protein
VWSANAFEKWRRRRYAALLAAAGLHSGRPYDLRHSFASLLLHEGRDVIYVARQLGHGAELTLRTYRRCTRRSLRPSAFSSPATSSGPAATVAAGRAGSRPGADGRCDR